MVRVVIYLAGALLTAVALEHLPTLKSVDPWLFCEHGLQLMLMAANGRPKSLRFLMGVGVSPRMQFKADQRCVLCVSSLQR